MRLLKVKQRKKNNKKLCTLKNYFNFITLLISAVFFLSSRVLCAEDSHLYGDAFVSGSIADAIILVPFLADDSTSSVICGQIFNGLTKVDKNLNIVGDLAKNWHVSEDKLTITFYLREDVFWHDGRKLSAEDVKFTFDSILNPRNACPYTASFQDIKEIKIIDKQTIQFKYQKPYAPALLKLGTGIIPKHILKDKDIRTSDFKRRPIGCGPYKIEDWQTDQHITLVSFDDYFEGRPFIDRYVMRIIPDQAVQFLELVTGSIDYMNLTPYQYSYRTQTKKFKERFDKYKYLDYAYTYIGYNLKDELFKDKRVRCALSRAVNKENIIDGVLMGLGEECTGPFLKGSYAYNEEAKRYPYDPKKAMELLEDAGWYDTDNNGILDKDGREFSFKLIINQGNKQREDIATLIQHDWEKIGIKVEVQTIAWAAFINEFIDKGNFQAIILGWTLPIDPDAYNVWHSDSTKEGGLNFIGYKNKEVDRLLEEGRETFDQDKRGIIYRKIHEIIAEDQPYTFLYFPYALPAVSKRFKGIEPAPAGISYNFIKWYVPEKEQKYVW